MTSHLAQRCPRCANGRPTSARFCHRCGWDYLALRPTTGDRMASYVVCPAERVRSVNVVTALLPLSTGRGVHAYQCALALTVAIAVAAAVAGLVSFAVVTAAAAVPVVVTIYLYDVNEWDDEPLPVVLACLVSSGLLGAATSWVLGAEPIGSGEVVRLGVVAPLLALALSLLGPLWLASRPRFDDMIDALTFGTGAGAAYAAGETVMTHRHVFDGPAGRRANAELWVSIVANAAIVKPIVYAAAVAIAAAGFSGIGSGYEGFRRRFAAAAAMAIAGMVAYTLGVAVLGDLDVDRAASSALALAWGLVVAAVLIVVLRTQLHLGILEAGLLAAQGRPSRHEAVAGASCGECEMPLAPLALFCSACGTSARAMAKSRQRHNTGRSTFARGVR